MECSNTREFLDVAREWAGRVKSNCIGGAFRKAKYEKLRRRKKKRRKRGRAKIPSPHPLPFCPPELKSFSKFSVWIFTKKSSDFVQRSHFAKATRDKSEPNCMLRVCCLGAEFIRSSGGRLGRQIV